MGLGSQNAILKPNDLRSHFVTSSLEFFKRLCRCYFMYNEAAGFYVVSYREMRDEVEVISG